MQSSDTNQSSASPSLPSPRNASAELAAVAIDPLPSNNNTNLLSNIKNLFKLRRDIAPVQSIDPNDLSMHDIVSTPTTITSSVIKRIKSALLFSACTGGNFIFINCITYLICGIRGNIVNNFLTISFTYFLILNVGLAILTSLVLHGLYQALKYSIDSLTKPLLLESIKQLNNYKKNKRQQQQKKQLVHNYNQQKMALYAYIINETLTPLQVALANMRTISTQLTEQPELSILISQTVGYLRKIELIINHLHKLYELLANHVYLAETIFTPESLINSVFKHLVPYTTTKNVQLVYDSNFNKDFKLIGDFKKIFNILTNLLVNIINRTNNNHTIKLVINKELEQLSYVQLYCCITTGKNIQDAGYNSGSTSESEETTNTEHNSSKKQKYFASKASIFDTTIANKLINELNENNLFPPIENVMGIKCCKKKPIFWFRLSVQKIPDHIISQQEYFNATQVAANKSKLNLSRTESLLPQYKLSSQAHNNWSTQCTASSSTDPEIHEISRSLSVNSRRNLQFIN